MVGWARLGAGEKRERGGDYTKELEEGGGGRMSSLENGLKVIPADGTGGRNQETL